MPKIISWSTPAYSESAVPHETDCLFYAEDVVRYYRYASPFSLKYCFQGNMPYFLENQGVNVPAGACFSTNTGTELECLPCEPGMSALIVFFTPSLLNDVWHTRASPPQPLLDQPGSALPCPKFFEQVFRHSFPIAGRFEQLGNAMRAAEQSQNDLLPDLFFDLAEQWFSLQGNIDRQIGSLKAGTAATRLELYRRVSLGRDLMFDQWNQPLSLQTIARQACLSPYHFHRSFREAFGAPPMQWLRQLRLEKAETMLRAHTGSVADIAFACGFSDIFAFSKAFKRYRGVPPTGLS